MDDKTIAIATWWSYLNCGGLLQAYALQRILRMWGYDSEFVRLLSPRGSFSHRMARLLKDGVVFVSRPRLYQARRQMSRFIENHLVISEPFHTYDELANAANKRYSAAICGSDQIWSNVGGIVDPLFYLTFIEQNKRIAYGPSIGYSHVSSDVIDEFREYVRSIPHLSVREKRGAELIKEITGRYAYVVLDPSLLLTAEQWQEETASSVGGPHKDSYIFCYWLADNPEYSRLARSLADATGCSLVAMEPVARNFRSLDGVWRIVSDPFDFVQLISGATYVLTDSFHATAFSINFRKQFGVFRRFHDDDPVCQNSRIYNILEMTHLESQLLDSDVALHRFGAEKIDYDHVSPLLRDEREHSMAYLRGALTNVLGH